MFKPTKFSNKVSIVKDSNIKHEFVQTKCMESGSKDYKCKHCNYSVNSIEDIPKYSISLGPDYRNEALVFIPHEDHAFYSMVFEPEDFSDGRQVVLTSYREDRIYCNGNSSFTSSKDVECIDEDNM